MTTSGTGRAMAWGTTFRLAASGGTADGTRIVLTALGTAAGTIALLAAVSVATIGPGDGPYTSALLNEPGLHPGVVAALTLLCLPVLAFVGQCARIGAPARDRRLAALRLQGATPGDVVRVAAAETSLSAGAGAAAGAAFFFLLRVLLGHPVVATYTQQSQVTYDNGSIGFPTDTITAPALRFPTDVVPPWPVVVLVVLALPMTAALFTTFALRRVTLSPFGVVAREQSRPARVLPAALFLTGTGGLLAFTGLRRVLGLETAYGALGAGVAVLFLLTAVGLLLGTSAISVGIGRLLVARTRRPSLLLAGRRLMAAPGQNARAYAAVLLVVMLWAFGQGVRVWLLTGISGDDSFYVGALALVDTAFTVAAVVAAASLFVGTAEGTLVRRRSLASLAAAGTPRAVLYRAVLVETLAPLAPAVLLAATAGIVAARGVFGTTVDRPDGPGVASLPVPWQALGTLTGGTLLAVLVLSALALPLVRRSASPSELRTA